MKFENVTEQAKKKSKINQICLTILASFSKTQGINL